MSALSDGQPTPEEYLAQLSIELPREHPTVANYVKVVAVGNLLFVAGHGAFAGGQPIHLGRVGADLSLQEGRDAAEAVMLNVLGSLKAELGELSRVRRFVKLLVFVNSTPDFSDQHLVADGATDLLFRLFRERGKTARSAVGVAALPLGFAVEIEAVVEVEDG